MANLEKHVRPIHDLEDAEGCEVPMHVRGARVVGQYTKNRRALPRRRHAVPPDQTAAHAEVQPVLIELHMDPTPGNLARMDLRLERLNRELEESGTPVRLRMVD